MMITERQVALDLGMRLRLAGVDYPEREDEWQYYDTPDIEVTQGKQRLYRSEHYWNVERKCDGGGTETYSWRSYGKAMNKFVEFVLEEYGYAAT